MQLSKGRTRALVWALALLPGVVALGFLGSADFASAGAILNTLGRLTGIWGMALLLIAAALCCRVPGFDRPFGGLTKLWQLHHQLGAVAFLLLLAHPILLALAAVEVSLGAAIGTLFSWQAAIVWGWVALLALMVFMAPSFAFFGPVEYQRWKWLHRLSAVTVVFALVHTLMLSRSLPGSWAWLIWGILAVLTLSALGYRWAFSRWRGRPRYRIVKIEQPANNVVELSLQPLSTLLRYQAGQFVYLTPYDPGLTAGRGEEHPYTISSAPDESVLRITIKDLGDASRALQSVALGSEVAIEGPYGRFSPDDSESQAKELWVAGGIGITPFIGRLRHCVNRARSLDVHLIDCVQDESRLLFADELKALVAALPKSRLSQHFFYRQGPLDLAYIRSVCPDFAERRVYICGPVPLIDSVRRQLISAGMPREHIVTEEFVLL